MATSLTLENDSSLSQGYIKVNGSTAATLTTSGITANLTGNVTGNATTATKLSTTTGSAPAYACRAWVNFDGQRDTTGAVSTANTNRLIRASGNVTSVLRNSAGNYTITFTTTMTDANYCFSSASNRVGTTSLTGNQLISQNTSNVTFALEYGAGFGANDASIISITIFGN